MTLFNTNFNFIFFVVEFATHLCLNITVKISSKFIINCWVKESFILQWQTWYEPCFNLTHIIFLGGNSEASQSGCTSYLHLLPHVGISCVVKLNRDPLAHRGLHLKFMI